MRRLLDAFPVIITIFLALCLTASGGYNFVYDNIVSAVITDQTTDITSDVLKDETPSEEEKDSQNTDKNESSPESVNSSSQTSSVIETSGELNAAGKIVEQFISPYSAKYSYNNVYMKNTSGISIDLKTELSAKLGFKIKKTSSPEVLIVHTHGTESYMNEERDYYLSSDATRTTDNTKNVIHIGDIVANRLKASGVGVIHDTTQHDYPSYNSSYSRAEVTIKEYLKKYPSIKVVIDLHRDSISLNSTDRVRPVATIDGKEAAQVMLVMGSQSGTITNFPNWRENFRLAVRLQQTMEVMYPGLARPIVLASKLYNENLTTGSMLIEVGTESNLLCEAEYSAELIGNALVGLFNTLG